MGRVLEVRAGADGPDAVLALVAQGQRGLVTDAQLLAAGLHRGAIKHRVARGRLHRWHRGVYRVGHRAPIALARELAAVLACGPNAVLSHVNAGALWGFGQQRVAGVAVDVTVPLRSGSRRAGINVHRVRSLPAADVTIKADIPVTTPARTLLDLAEVLPARSMARAVEEAQVLGHVTRASLRELLTRARGRRGAAPLGVVLDHDRDVALTRSEAEQRLRDLLRRGGLKPRFNVRIAGYEVDVLFESAGLVVEVDGFAFHAGRAAFERDRRRDADLQAAGLRVMRVTWRQLTEEPEAVLVRIVRALGVRGA